jgi:hypothetical protein
MFYYLLTESSTWGFAAFTAAEKLDHPAYDPKRGASEWTKWLQRDIASKGVAGAQIIGAFYSIQLSQHSAICPLGFAANYISPKGVDEASTSARS